MIKTEPYELKWEDARAMETKDEEVQLPTVTPAPAPATPTPCNCEICQDAHKLEAIAEKCTKEERKFLNQLWARIEAAETELEWRAIKGESCSATTSEKIQDAINNI